MKFERISWAEIEPHLGRALDVQDVRAAVGDEVMSGRAEAWRIAYLSGLFRTHMVTRVEGSELVVVAYEGTRAVQTLKAIMSFARSRGFRTMRFHTISPAVIRLVKVLRPEPIEYVMRIALHG